MYFRQYYADLSRLSDVKCKNLHKINISVNKGAGVGQRVIFRRAGMRSGYELRYQNRKPYKDIIWTESSMIEEKPKP